MGSSDPKPPINWVKIIHWCSKQDIAKMILRLAQNSIATTGLEI